MVVDPTISISSGHWVHDSGGSIVCSSEENIETSKKLIKSEERTVSLKKEMQKFSFDIVDNKKIKRIRFYDGDRSIDICSIDALEKSLKLLSLGLKEIKKESKKLKKEKK